MNILFMDNEPEIVLTFQECFARSDVITLGAVNKDECFEHLKASRFDLIVSDYYLGEKYDVLDMINYINDHKESMGKPLFIIFSGERRELLERVATLEETLKIIIVQKPNFKELRDRVESFIYQYQQCQK